jgi:hypothetical protein
MTLTLGTLGMTLTMAQPCAAQSALGGGTGLLNVPSAEVLAEGDGTFQYTRFHPDLERTTKNEAWYAGAGFAPGLELGGRAIASALRAGRRDLSLDAKYRLPWTAGRVGFALGAQDVGGVERLLPREYAVATWSSQYVDVTAGYGRGRNVLDGPFGGVAFQPWPYVAALVEHDAEDLNAGLHLAAPTLAGWRLGATAAWRGAVEDVEYAIQVTFPFARKKGVGSIFPAATAAEEAKKGVGSIYSGGDRPKNGSDPFFGAPGAKNGSDPFFGGLRGRLLDLGFEGVRVGRRADVLVVQLENRSYNHSAADGIEVALGAIAEHVGTGAQRIELYQHAYGVPQLKVTSACADAHCAFHAEPASQITDTHAIAWDGPVSRYRAVELVAEPVLRTAVATEYGMLDYAVGARLRLTAPLARGLLANVGVAAPVTRSDDFADGRPFADLAIRPGVDLALLQYLHAPAAGWTLLWSAGRARVFQLDTRTVALEQAWMPGAGRHRFRAKLMAMRSDVATREIALAGYNWLDARRRYGIGLTGGRFYAGDAGGRIDIERHFGDTILGLFYKAAGSADQAAGVTLSMPLTPRRDAQPRHVQLKGPRRWTHSLGTTLNGPPTELNPDGSNPIRPLLLYEPTLELDLERDIHDSGRLNHEWLRANR